MWEVSRVITAVGRSRRRTESNVAMKRAMSRRFHVSTLQSSQSLSKGDLLYGKVAKVLWRKPNKDPRRRYGFAFYRLEVSKHQLNCQGCIPLWCKDGSYVRGKLNDIRQRDHNLEMATLQLQSKSKSVIDGVRRQQGELDDSGTLQNSKLTNDGDQNTESNATSSQMSVADYRRTSEYQRRLALLKDPELNNHRTNQFVNVLRNDRCWQNSFCFDTEYFIANCPIDYHRLFEISMFSNQHQTEFQAYLKLEHQTFDSRRKQGVILESIAKILSFKFGGNGILNREVASRIDEASLLPGQMIAELHRYWQQNLPSSPTLTDIQPCYLFHHFGHDSKLLQSLLTEHSDESVQNDRIVILNTAAIINTLFPKTMVQRDLTSLLNGYLPTEIERRSKGIDLTQRHTADMDARCLSEVLCGIRQDLAAMDD